MAKIICLSGTVSNVSTLLGHAVAFRIDNKPIRFNPGMLNLSEGDDVKVAGFDKRGELQATVIRNITTGVSSSDKFRWIGTVYIPGGIFLIVLAIILAFWVNNILFIIFFVIPILLIQTPFLVWAILYNAKVNRSEKLLERFNVEYGVFDDNQFT